MKNEFIFLYPIPEIIDTEIKLSFHPGKWKNEKELRESYRETLNRAIRIRYRENGFGINYVLFKDSEISDVIDSRECDGIIYTDIDFDTHTTAQADGSYPYPDQDSILDFFRGSGKLVISGFHSQSCVDMLAKRAYECGFDTLVDEDLTETIFLRLGNPNFIRLIETGEYPIYDPEEGSRFLHQEFKNFRKDRPWLWRDCSVKTTFKQNFK